MNLEERPIHRLLRLILSAISNTTRRCLCSYVLWLHFDGIISFKEHETLLKYIEDNKPTLGKLRSIWSLYYWPVYNKKPRIRWLKKHIKLTGKSFTNPN